MAERDLKVAWFDRGAAALNAVLVSPVGEFYVCPLCLEPFGRDKIDSSLTFEHAPPESVGGHRVALTCGPCNHAAGTRLDAAMERDEATRAFLRSGGSAPYPVTVTRHGVPVRGELAVGAESISFDVISKQNDPKRLEQFQASAVEWTSTPRAGRSFSVNIPVRLDSRRTHLGWLRTAHVVAFGCFGYLYALQPAVRVLIEQFRRPDERAGLSGNPAAAASGLVSAVAMVTVATVIAVELRSEKGPIRLQRLIAFTIRGAQRIARRPKGDPPTVARAVLDAVERLRLGPGTLARLVFWGSVNWWADVACLAFAMWATGVTGLSIGKILLVWAAGAAAATLSPTPAGIGVVEVAMVAAMAAVGVKDPSAITAVLVYRVISLKGAVSLWAVIYSYIKQRRLICR